MIYLDYSATTKTKKEVLDTFIKVSEDFPFNSNSLHKLGVDAKKIEESSTKQIAKYLNIKEEEIIYTSGSSESNNTAILGVCLKYQGRGKHILTTKLEHSSIYGPLSYLQKLGFEVEFLKTNGGVVDSNDLKNKLRKDTLLVTISAVASETGSMQNIEELSKIIKQNQKTFFHVDMTQAIGKVHISFENIDLASISAHKIYGIKGIGMLYKSSDIEIEPLIHGGKSTTKYRSGTPAVPLIASFAKAIRLELEHLDENYNKVKELSTYLKGELSKIKEVTINSDDTCIAHIVSISILNQKPEVILHALEEKEIYISTKSACSVKNVSDAVLELTGNIALAETSLRISISYLTTKEEIDTFIFTLKDIIKKLGELIENHTH